MERFEVEIGGMSCGHCVARVRKTLEAMPGVRVERVAVGSAAVDVDAGVTSIAKVEQAIADVGFVPVRTGGTSAPKV